MGIELSGECLSEYRIIGAYRGAIGDHYRIIEPGLRPHEACLQHVWALGYQYDPAGQPGLLVMVVLALLGFYTRDTQK